MVYRRCGLSSISFSALQIQAATGLLAIIVLLVIMNWFFHKLYWTGWITMHNRRKRDLAESPAEHGQPSSEVWSSSASPPYIAKVLKSSCSCKACAASGNHVVFPGRLPSG